MKTKDAVVEAEPCKRCGHPVVHFLSGACRRVGCTKCPQRPATCASCKGPISLEGYCRCSDLS